MPPPVTIGPYFNLLYINLSRVVNLRSTRDKNPKTTIAHIVHLKADAGTLILKGHPIDEMGTGC